ncbi:MAG TPA: S16 family serine protease, partial [Thermoanaerobaculia bacterium]
PIGGVKEKVLAARQAQLRTIVLPRLNRRDVLQITPRIIHGMDFEYVDNVDQVLSIALIPDGAKAPEGRAEPGGGRLEIPVAPEGRTGATHTRP